MIQLSFRVLGASEVPVPPPPLKVARVDGGVRVAGVWEATPLALARAEMAAWLSGLAPDAEVEDLLLGTRATAAETAARLAAPPSPATCLTARHATWGDRVWIRLFGLYQLGRPDLLVAVEPDVPLSAAYDLVTRLGAAHLDNDRAFPDDRPIPFGYWLLAFGGAELGDAAFWEGIRDALATRHLQLAFDEGMATPAPRIVLEAAPDDAGPDPDRWLIGATHAVRTFAAQARAAARFGLGPLGAAPNAHDAAVVCARIDAADGFFAYREAPQGPLDSGWRFACLDPAHVHDDAAMRLSTLRHLPARLPPLAQYLALPEGWVVTWDEASFWTTAPGDERSILDPGAEHDPPWHPPRADGGPP